MKESKILCLIIAAGLSTGAIPAAAATADLHGANGEELGSVHLGATPNGLLLRANLYGLPPGTHAIHIHERGACSPGFEAAGGHLAGSASAHGFEVEEGPHAGDLPNIHVPDSGELSAEIFNAKLSLREGSAALTALR